MHLRFLRTTICTYRFDMDIGILSPGLSEGGKCTCSKLQAECGEQFCGVSHHVVYGRYKHCLPQRQSVSGRQLLRVAEKALS